MSSLTRTTQDFVCNRIKRAVGARQSVAAVLLLCDLEIILTRVRDELTMKSQPETRAYALVSLPCRCDTGRRSGILVFLGFFLFLLASPPREAVDRHLQPVRLFPL